MKRDATKRFSSAARMASYLFRDGRKTGLAIALIAVMAVMWLRVLTGQKPKSAEAGSKSTHRTAQPQTPSKEMRFVELPVEAGRNDRIHRDFFTTQDWSLFSSGTRSQGTATQAEVQKAATNRTQEVVERLAKTLRLEVVVLVGEGPQAVVNDRRVRIGDTFTLKDGADVYVFEVVQIEEDAVIVTCQGRQWTLKLSHRTDVVK
jgi:hypothetical protein